MNAENRISAEDMVPLVPVAAAFIEVSDELASARERFPVPFHTPHEGWAVIREELDELWEEVKDNKRPDAERVPLMRKEAMQVAAMAIRFMLDVCEVPL
jgi:hypothetical protein